MSKRLNQWLILNVALLGIVWLSFITGSPVLLFVFLFGATFANSVREYNQMCKVKRAPVSDKINPTFLWVPRYPDETNDEYHKRVEAAKRLVWGEDS